MNKIYAKTLAIFLGLSLCTSPAFSFDPDNYTYTTQPIAVDEEGIIILRVYDNGQLIEFSAGDLNSNEGDEAKVGRSFNNSDLANVFASMSYVKDVFGVPDEAPVIETFTDTEDNASFESPISITTGGISGTRLSTWFLN